MSEEQNSIEDKPINCKIILVGDSGVGKTSIIARYLSKYSPNIVTTINTSFYSKLVIIDDYKINFQIWDTVGQEKYRSLNSLFFKDANICILVYDITKEESFNNIKNYWYESVITNGSEGIICGVAGNKSDLYEFEKNDRNEVTDFCKEINAVFRFTSAKNNYCVDELFKELGEKFMNSDYMKKIKKNKEIKRLEIEKFNIEQGKNANDIKKEKKGCC